MADKVQTAQELIESKAIAGLDEIQKWVESGKEFVMDQAPMVVHEMIMWGLSRNVFWVVLMLFFIILLVSLWIYVGKLPKLAEEKDSKGSYKMTADMRDTYVGTWIAARIISCMGTLLCFSMMAVAIYDFLFIWFAPRLFILNELATLAAKFAGKH